MKTKKIASTVLSMVLIAALALPVSAATFVNSIEQKSAPSMPSSSTPQATTANGEVMDLDLGDIIVTALNGDSTHDLTEEQKAEIQENLDNAQAEIEAASSCADVFGETVDGETLPDNAVVSDLFDVTFEGTMEDTVDQVISGGGTVTLHFDIGVEAGKKVWAYTKCESSWKGHKVANNDDGTVSVTFTEFCPVAFVVESTTSTSSTSGTTDGSGTSTDGSAVSSPQTSDSSLPVAGMTAVCCVVLAGGCFAVSRRKHA